MSISAIIFRGLDIKGVYFNPYPASGQDRWVPYPFNEFSQVADRELEDIRACWVDKDVGLATALDGEKKNVLFRIDSASISEITDAKCHTHGGEMVRTGPNDVKVFGGFKGDFETFTDLVWDVSNVQRDPSTRVVGHMREKRYGHTATRLSNGTVLVCGGTLLAPYVQKYIQDKEVNMEDSDKYYKSLDHLQNDHFLQSSCERFGVTMDRSETAAVMHYGRGFHSACLLADGRVLVSGGYRWLDEDDDEAEPSNWDAVMDELSTCEIYDPETNKWTVVADMPLANYNHCSMLDNNGDVVVFGGYHAGKVCTYSVKNNSWTSYTSFQSEDREKKDGDAHYMREGSAMLVQEKNM